MFGLRKIFDLRKIFALPDNFLESKNDCTKYLFNVKCNWDIFSKTCGLLRILYELEDQYVIVLAFEYELKVHT